MGLFGRWLGGSLGWVLGGPIGGLMGLLAGSMVDEDLSDGRTARGDFGISLLILLAAVMKADGPVVKSELDYVKVFLIRQFGRESAKEALITLKDIIKKDIPAREVCIQIGENMDYSSRLQLLHLLFNVSISDTRIHQLEVELIEKMARAMGISSDDFRSVKNMFIPETDSSYRILEIDPSSPDKEVKKAYRKMAMKYHPDKVGHLGDSIRKGADEKFKKVNEAYERIKRERNMV
jgi:DnaJ like chaperone protein